MTNPPINIARFSSAKLKSQVADQYAYPVYRDANYSNDLADLIEVLAEQHAVQRAPRLWAFAEYDRFHTNGDIRCNGALALEWDRPRYDDVLAWAGDAQANCYTLLTQPSVRDERVALIIPFSTPIMEKASYTRIASLIALDIGLDGMTDGYAARTFLIAPADRIDLKIHFKIDGSEINPYEVIDQNTGVWAKAEDWVGYTDAPKPRPFSPVIERLSRLRAQLDSPLFI